MGAAAYVRAVLPWAVAYGRAARPWAAQAASDARAQAQAAVAEVGAEPAEAAEPDVPEAAVAAAAAERDAVLQPGAAAEAAQDAVLRPEEEAAAEPVAPELPLAAVHPSVGLSVDRWDQPPPWLAQRRVAQFARAMRKSRVVSRSEQWWPAAGCEDLS